MRDGKIIAGPHVRNACARHLKDLKDRKKTGLVWDLLAMRRSLAFFPHVLRLAGGQFEGSPFELAPSQMFIVGSLFGWKRKDGFRRFRRAYIEQGKGNGKSPLAAGIGLYGMMSDGEARAEIYAAAAKKDQAMILFRDAVAMVEQSPALDKRIIKSGGNPVWSLAYSEAGSFFRPISSDDSQSGPRPHMALCDEVHEHRTRDTVDMLERGFKFRQQPLLFMITNSGSDRTSFCFEEHEHAVNVASGRTVDDTTFSYVCALDEGDDPLEDPSCWAKVNPLLGVILTEDYLAGVVAQAKAIPGKLNGILRLHFCVWTDAEEAWLPASTWMGVEDDQMQLEDFEGQSCWISLDLSAKKDLCAASIGFKDGTKPMVTEEGEEKLLQKYAVFTEFWTPNDTLEERAVIDKAPYDIWRDEGYLHSTPGKLVRFDYIVHRVAEWANMFEVKGLIYDCWLFDRFEEELDEVNLVLPVIEHPQGWNRRKDTELWMPGSIDEFEAAILQERFRHNVNPVMRWCVTSAVFETSAAGLRRFTKRKATGRIDGAVSGAMCIGGMDLPEAKPKRSLYEDEDFFL